VITTVFDVDESGAGNTNADGYINGEMVSMVMVWVTGQNQNVLGLLMEMEYRNLWNIRYLIMEPEQMNMEIQGVATGNSATTYLKDTDGDGKPDYLDLTSNGTTLTLKTIN
jgi:hypothetical protein